MPRIPSRPPLDLGGEWVVDELPTLAVSDARASEESRITITHDEFYSFTVIYSFAGLRGDIDGRVEENWKHAADLFGTFVGVYDGDVVSGAVDEFVYTEDKISGVMRFHRGPEDLLFVWRRASQSAKSSAATAPGKPSPGTRKVDSRRRGKPLK